MAATSWDFLLNLAVEAPMATSFRLIPEGEYRAKIVDLTVGDLTIGKGERKGTHLPKLNLKWEILDEKLAAEFEREQVFLNDNFILDMDAYNNLDTGPDKNITLGRLREALDLNEGRFNLGMLKGTPPIMIVIKHDIDKDDPEKIYQRVSKFAKLV